MYIINFIVEPIIKPSTLDGNQPIVICHRGSGYFPEHTIEGYADIIRCNPEFIGFFFSFLTLYLYLKTFSCRI